MLSSLHLALPSPAQNELWFQNKWQHNGNDTNMAFSWTADQLRVCCDWWTETPAYSSTITDLHCSPAICSRSQGGPQRAIQSNPQHRENSSLTVSLPVKSFWTSRCCILSLTLIPTYALCPFIRKLSCAFLSLTYKKRTHRCTTPFKVSLSPTFGKEQFQPDRIYFRKFLHYLIVCKIEYKIEKQ